MWKEGFILAGGVRGCSPTHMEAMAVGVGGSSRVSQEHLSYCFCTCRSLALLLHLPLIAANPGAALLLEDQQNSRQVAQ